jgi:hypothetical protein
LFAGKPLLALYAMNRMLWKILCTANRTSQKPEFLGPAGMKLSSKRQSAYLGPKKLPKL